MTTQRTSVAVRRVAWTAMALLMAGSAAAAPLSGRVTAVGAVAFSSTGIDFLPSGGGTGSFLVGDSATLSGDFVALAGTSGSFSDLGASLPATFATFAANPDIVFTITSLDPGIFSSAACGAAPAAGQTCSPVGSPFDLLNTGAGSTLTFTIHGTAKRISTGAVSTLVGVFTTQFSGSSYQSILSTVGAGGSVTAEYSAEFDVTTTVPTLTTQASAATVVGGSISDTATITGGNATIPTGTITFTLFGPDDATCGNTPIFTSTVPVSSGNGSYPSDPFSPTEPGTYRWIASYSGDVSNSAVSTTCGDAAEAVVVSLTVPALSTAASGNVPLGGAISDSATLSNGNSPTGTIRFDVFGPNDIGCSGGPAFTVTVPVSGNGTYSSGDFVPTAGGSYRFVATYSGDAANASVSTPCGDPAEVANVAIPVSVPATSPIGAAVLLAALATLGALALRR